jgi:3-hydroxyisobutyrate dehydrogenase
MTRKIGFVGLGMMGLPMVENLATAAPELCATLLAFDTAEAPFDVLASHPGWGRQLVRAATLDELANCEIVITMLPNSAITNHVLDALRGVLARGAIIIDMGSSDPAETQRQALVLAEANIALVDAPVSGAVAKARVGTLAIMAGGDDAVVDAVRPLLESMGSALIRTGAVGSAHAMKSLNNYVYAAGLLATSEAVLIAQSMGLDLEVLADVLNASSGRNVATETKLRQFILPRTFNAGFALRLQAKDLATASSLQALADVDAPQLSLCARLWEEAAKAMPQQADNTEIARFLEIRAPV